VGAPLVGELLELLGKVDLVGLADAHARPPNRSAFSGVRQPAEWLREHQGRA
jgi:hypothetical protein